MRVYNKLVRNKIPDIIRANGEQPVTKELSNEDYYECLKQKLCEEAEEFRKDGSIEELADVCEVILALSECMHIGIADINEVRRQKAASRGNFSEKVFLLSVLEDTAKE